MTRYPELETITKYTYPKWMEFRREVLKALREMREKEQKIDEARETQRLREIEINERYAR